MNRAYAAAWGYASRLDSTERLPAAQLERVSPYTAATLNKFLATGAALEVGWAVVFVVDDDVAALRLERGGGARPLASARAPA